MLQESCFPDCWKVSSVVPVFKTVEERSKAKNYRPASLLSAASKVFGKLVNNRIVDHQEKCGHFSNFQYGFKSSWPTPDLLTVVSDKNARALKRFWATRAIALDISKAFDRVWHARLLQKLKSSGILGQTLGLISSLIVDSFKWFWMGSLHNNIQLMLESLRASFLVLHFCYYGMTFLMILCVILLSMLMILPSILCVIRHLIYGNILI